MKDTKECGYRVSGLNLWWERKEKTGSHVEIVFHLKSEERCILHWGCCRREGGAWEKPPGYVWPEGTAQVGESAVETPFVPGSGEQTVSIGLSQDLVCPFLVFVLFFPGKNLWENNHGKNYFVPVFEDARPGQMPEEVMHSQIHGKELLSRRLFELEGNRQLAVAVAQEPKGIVTYMITDLQGPLFLHWGVVRRNRAGWLPPPDSMRPPGSADAGSGAVQTPFRLERGLYCLKLKCGEDEDFTGISFVLKQAETGRWIKNGGCDFFIPLQISEHEKEVYETPELADMAETIIQAETDRNSWTLMHRFNLCHDLLDRVVGDVQGLALIFVWLRFSAIRQLDWQRNYNTKPRELAHAQKRLTLKLASMYRGSSLECRELIRLILTTVGPGGEAGKGQRIRDDILNIMHRHRIKEVTGHFLEEWHQKLHNNATPDDIVICEAYLEFLRSYGDLGRFYEVLENGGVTSKRLRSFERPIVTDPDFNPHIRDGLIHDFENYLELLKSVHSGTDFLSAARSAKHCLDDEMNGRVYSVYHDRNNEWIQIVERVERIVYLRHDLTTILDFQEDSQCVRDLIYLDIALEEVLRMLVEHNSGADTGVDQLAGLIGVVMDNFGLSRHDPEILCCFNQWCRLAENPGYDRDWCLQARSVLERMSRVLGSTVDYYDSMLQPKADHLGERFHADPWTVELFTQEVVRGSGAFILSLLAGYMEPALRKSAELGDWQVISHQEAAGRIVAERLVAVQAEKIDSPTIILTDRITGDEEIPPGVTGVITPEPVDIVSHVSIRARNAGILFATCYSRDIMDELHSFKGSVLRFWIDSAGHVNFEPEEAGKAFTGPEESGIDVPVLKCRRVKFESYAVASRDLDYSVAGGKANRLAGLRGRLPDWIRTPRSVVIPFCVCEKVMENLENNALRRSYDQLVRRVDEKPEEILPLLKEVIMQLGEPEELKSAFFSAVEAEGLVWPGGTGSNWDTVWKRIRQIWASKWNERAYWSRKKWGIGHESLIMAVLVQEVVDAEYAFVIHTNNPFTGNSDEIYAEVVPGLGETLCSGNYPGRAFSFICSRNGEFSPGILSYPGKSVALRGGGIIFRSDSNGEDLSNYAGAGLYDSVLMNPPADELLDYTEISLLWDEDFRNTFMCRVAELGMEIENALDGAPQDIEGAYSGGQYYCVQTRPQVG